MEEGTARVEVYHSHSPPPSMCLLSRVLLYLLSALMLFVEGAATIIATAVVCRHRTVTTVSASTELADMRGIAWMAGAGD